MNRILGEDRMLVDPRPGTTRDAIDSLVERGDKKYIFVDTAGVRRKGKVTKASDAIEAGPASPPRSTRWNARASSCSFATQKKASPRKTLRSSVSRTTARAMIIALNKTDLLSKEELKKAEESAREKISFAPFVPVCLVSAKTGRGVASLFEKIDEVAIAYHSRVSTGQLNRFFETVLDTRPPPTMGGRAPRLYYITQAESSPPLFVIISSSPDSVHFPPLQRFVVNQLRKEFGFEGVPIRVVYREKRRGKKKTAADREAEAAAAEADE